MIGFVMQGGSAWGMTFLLWFAIATSAYAAGGAAFGSKLRAGGEYGSRRRLGPLSPHPHAAVWLEIAGLVSDGLAFARGGGKNTDSRAYDRKQRQLLGGGGNDGAKKARQDQHHKGANAGKKGTHSLKKDRKKQGRNSTGKERVSAVAILDDASVHATPTAAPAKGGSWVHVPG